LEHWQQCKKYEEIRIKNQTIFVWTFDSSKSQHKRNITLGALTLMTKKIWITKNKKLNKIEKKGNKSCDAKLC